MQRETDNEEGLSIQPLYRLATHMQKPCVWFTSAVDQLTEDQIVKLECVYFRYTQKTETISHIFLQAKYRFHLCPLSDML